MAKATISIFPTTQQMMDINYSDLATTIDYLAKTFSKPRVNCSVSECGEWEDDSPEGFNVNYLAIWVDGIALPYDWFNVIGMSSEEKAIVEKHSK